MNDAFNGTAADGGAGKRSWSPDGEATVKMPKTGAPTEEKAEPAAPQSGAAPGWGQEQENPGRRAKETPPDDITVFSRRPLREETPRRSADAAQRYGGYEPLPGTGGARRVFDEYDEETMLMIRDTTECEDAPEMKREPRQPQSGARQIDREPPKRGYEPPQGGTAPAEQGDTAGKAVMVIAAIVGVVYLLNAVGTVFSCAAQVISAVKWGNLGLAVILNTLLRLVAAAGFAGMGVLTFCFGAQRGKTNRAVVFFSEAAVSVGLLLIGVLRLVTLLIASHRVSWGVLCGGGAALLVSAVSFGVMLLLGENPFDGSVPISPQTFQELPALLRSSFGSLKPAASRSAGEGKRRQQTPVPYGNGAAYGRTMQPDSLGAPVYDGNTGERLSAKRGVIKYLLLSVLTCGIYSWYFIYKTAKDMNTACAGDGETTTGLAKTVIFTILTCGIYSIYWWYRLANRACRNAPRYGLYFPEDGGAFLLWYFLGALLCGIGPLIALHNVMKNVNALCAAYNAALDAQGMR